MLLGINQKEETTSAMKLAFVGKRSEDSEDDD